MAYKNSFVKWVTGEGKATYAGYGFFSASLNLCDNFVTMDKEGNFKLPRRLFEKVSSKSRLSFLKWIDIVLQIFTGTLFFAMMQHGGELLREKYPKSILMGIGIGLASIGRVGLFFTQIIAGAIRLPLALISGIAGGIVGAYSAYTAKPSENKSNEFLYQVSNAVWPFVPFSGMTIAAYSPLKLISDNSNKSDNLLQRAFQTIETQAAIRIISTIIAIVLVALVASGTLGAGFAALPFVPQIAGGIATALNFLFSWAGVSLATSGAAAVAPLGMQVALGTMLVGGVSSLLSNFVNTVKDNGKACVAWVSKKSDSSTERLGHSDTLGMELRYSSPPLENQQATVRSKLDDTEKSIPSLNNDKKLKYRG